MIDHNEYNKYMERKLAHYNSWLLDNSREIGKPYPGFPEDKQASPVKFLRKKMNAFEQLEHDLKGRKQATAKAESATAKAESKPKAARQPRASGPTKADRALEIFKRLAGDKAAVIAAIKDELSMSDAGATTYFYNAKRVAK